VKIRFGFKRVALSLASITYCVDWVRGISRTGIGPRTTSTSSYVSYSKLPILQVHDLQQSSLFRQSLFHQSLFHQSLFFVLRSISFLCRSFVFCDSCGLSLWPSYGALWCLPSSSTLEIKVARIRNTSCFPSYLQIVVKLCHTKKIIIRRSKSRLKSLWSRSNPPWCFLRQLPRQS